MKWYRKAAEQNHAPAQYNLGNCYANGQGVAKDDGGGEMVSQSRRAESRQGSIQFGRLLRQRQGVAKDHAEAVKWYRKAAEQNLAEAQTNLGSCYANGQGVAKDEVEAVKWYRKAAEQKEATAENNWAAATPGQRRDEG